MNQEVGQPIRVMLVAPGINGWGLEQLIRSSAPRFEIVHTCDDMAAARDTATKFQLDVVLVDTDSPTGPELLESIPALLPAPVLLLTSVSDDAPLEPAVLAGLRGIVRRSDPPSSLIKALEKVASGELWMRRVLTGKVFHQFVHRRSERDPNPVQDLIGSLTPRELQMVAEITRDTSVPSKVIASRLFISEHTLRNHLTSVYSKLGVNNRLALYAFAVRHKLDGLPPNIKRPTLTRVSP